MPDEPGQDVPGAGGRKRGRRAGADSDRAVGSATIVSSPFRTTIAAAALGGLARAREPRGLDLARLDAEQPPELALVRREEGRRRTLAQRLEPPACAFSPSASISTGTGARRATSRAHSSAPSVRPMPGPSDERARLLGQLEHRSRPLGHVCAVVLGHAVRHRLHQLQVEGGLGRCRNRHLHVAGAGAHGGQRGHRRRPVSPRAPPATTTTPDLNFVPVPRPRRDELEHTVRDQPRPLGPRGAARDADLDDLDPAGVALPGIDVEPDLGAVERGGGVRPDGGCLDLAGGCVDARGDITGNDGRRGLVDRS